MSQPGKPYQDVREVECPPGTTYCSATGLCERTPMEFSGITGGSVDEPVKFKPGDVVQLKSGGPPMTVEEVDVEAGKHKNWIRTIRILNGEFKSEVFFPCTLNKTGFDNVKTTEILEELNKRGFNVTLEPRKE